MLRWDKVCTTIKGDGSRITRYGSQGSRYKIESRKRFIPHANGIGTWQYTSYYLISPDGTEREYHRLRDAQKAAEEAEA